MKQLKSRKAELAPNTMGGGKSHAETAARAEFKMTELGPIPVDWEVKRFDEAYSFAAASDLQKEWYSPIQDARHKYCIYSNGLSNNGLYGYTSQPRYNGNSITITGRGTLGHAEFRHDEFDAIIRLLILTPIVEVDNRFVVYWINHFKPFVNESTSIPQLTVPQVACKLFPLPPLAEQRRIAGALSDVDELISALGKLIEKKRNIKTGAMQQLLTGKTRLPGFKGKWEEKYIGEMTSVITGATPSTARADFWGGNIRWMSSGELNYKIVSEVEGRITKEGFEACSTHIIPIGCVLIGLAGQGKTRGTAAYNLVEMCTNQSIASILPASSFHSKFLYYYMDCQYDELRLISAGDGGRGGLTKGDIEKFVIIIPPTLAEQKAIAAVLSDMDAEIAALEADRAKYERIKSGMMQELLTGKTRLEA